jgi:sulfatase maturation enzyme AslB (radical SAM superfamily)
MGNILKCSWPWLTLFYSWDKFTYCCFGDNHDMGSISNYDPARGFDSVWNAPNIVATRRAIIQDRLPDVCTPQCPYLHLGAWENAWDKIRFYHKAIAAIDDTQHRLAVINNMEKALSEFTSKKAVVASRPVEVDINCGTKCNLRCKFCYHINVPYEVKPGPGFSIIDEIKDTLAVVWLTGGEAMLTKFGREMLRRLSSNEYRFPIVLGTNANFVDFKLLRNTKLVLVQISTDGATKQVYESVRVGGNFEKLIGNIKKFIELQKEKPYLTITTNYTVTSDNYHQIVEAVKLYEGMGLEVQFNLVMRNPGEPQNIRERLDLHDDLLKKIDQALAITKNEWTALKLRGMRETILDIQKPRVNKPAKRETKGLAKLIGKFRR